MMLKLLGLSVIATGGFLLAVGQAQAAGCNGVVNPAQWGCAPWDNNNGPQYPNYRGSQQRAAPAQARPQPQQQYRPQAQTPSHGGRILNQDNAGLIGHDGSTLIGKGGAGARGNNR